MNVCSDVVLMQTLPGSHLRILLAQYFGDESKGDVQRIDSSTLLTVNGNVFSSSPSLI